MLRIEYTIIPKAFFIPGSARYPVHLALRFFQDAELLASIERVSVDAVYDLRNWLISDFFYQKHMLLTDSGHALPFLVGLIHVPHQRGWQLMAQVQDQHYRVMPAVFSESEVQAGLNAFFQNIGLELRNFGVSL